jgi:pyruvate dehydrogenase phosphatase
MSPYYRYKIPKPLPHCVGNCRAKYLLVFSGMMFGVFDGHGGPACGQVIAKRIFNYIAASLLPSDVLHKLLNPNLDKSSTELLETYNDRFDLVEDLRILYNKHFKDFLQDLTAQDQTEFNMRSALERAFVRLDEDISKEAKLRTLYPELLQSYSKGKAQTDRTKAAKAEELYKKTLSIAVSGAVAAAAHIDGEHLHVASCGDCQVVLGVRTSETDSTDGSSTWAAQTLTTEHNSENAVEVERILSEHPSKERDRIIRNERLLGQLAPLRAFGDVRLVFSTDPLETRDCLL